MISIHMAPNGDTNITEYFETVLDAQSRARELNGIGFTVLISGTEELWIGYSAFKKNPDGTETSFCLNMDKFLPKWVGESFCTLYGCSGIATTAYLFTNALGKNSIVRYCQSCITASKALRDALERDEDFREISLEEADMIDIMES
jgi:hypothetical protein